MKLTLSLAAIDYLKRQLDKPVSLLLTLNDGSNQFSSAGGTCMIGDKFQLVALSEPEAPFTTQLSDSPFAIYTSDYDKMFLGQQITLDINPSSGTLALKNESGLLDNNLLINTTFLVASV